MFQERKENLSKQRYPLFAIVGALGIGKGKLAQAIAGDLRTAVYQKVFTGNHYLEGFYKDPKEYSFLAQMFFLLDRANKTRLLLRSLEEQAIIQSTAPVQDFLIAEAHWQMGLMSNQEFVNYRTVYQRLRDNHLLPEPDIYITLLATPQVVKERISQQGEEIEREMLERNPNYFYSITEKVNAWILENKYNRGVVFIDVERYGDLEKPQYVLEEIRNWSRYYLENQNQMHGLGKDGARLLTEFLRPRFNCVLDVPPSLSPESKRFYGS